MFKCIVHVCIPLWFQELLDQYCSWLHIACYMFRWVFSDESHYSEPAVIRNIAVSSLWTIANFQIKTKGNETKSTKMAETAQKFSSNNVSLVNCSNSGFFSHWLSKRNRTCLNVTWLMTFDDISSVCCARSVLCHQLHSYNWRGNCQENLHESWTSTFISTIFPAGWFQEIRMSIQNLQTYGNFSFFGTFFALLGSSFNYCLTDNLSLCCLSFSRSLLGCF